MATIEVTRTLVKSAPELWADLESGRLSEALGDVTTHPEEHERRLAWEGDGMRGTAVLEPSGWGTQVTLTAEVAETVTEMEEAVARAGLWSRLRARRTRPTGDDPSPGEPSRADAAPAGTSGGSPAGSSGPSPAGSSDTSLEDRLRNLLDDLGMAHRRPYVGQ